MRIVESTQRNQTGKERMKIIEIAFTGYPVTDLKRARQFYEGTLGLTAARTGGDETRGWIEYDIGPRHTVYR